MGEITDNDLGNIVEFNNASPRPTVIRYVYRLNKPINEILDELKKEAGVEEGNSFGEDFDFDAWITAVSYTHLASAYASVSKISSWLIKSSGFLDDGLYIISPFGDVHFLHFTTSLINVYPVPF